MSELKPAIFRGTCTIEQKKRWEKAAEQTKRSLADWMRLMLDEAAERELEQEQAEKPKRK